MVNCCCKIEKLTAAQQQQVKKMSNDRLRVKLIAAGYEEDEVLGYERDDLMSLYAGVNLKLGQSVMILSWREKDWRLKRRNGKHNREDGKQKWKQKGLKQRKRNAEKNASSKRRKSKRKRENAEKSGSFKRRNVKKSGSLKRRNSSLKSVNVERR